MNNNQAKLILAACRPSGQDQDDATFRDALDAAERDPMLASWFANEQTLDHVITEKMAAIPVPVHLREEILAAARVTRPKPFWGDSRTWASAAAAVVVAAGVVWTKSPPGYSDLGLVSQGSIAAPAVAAVGSLASFRSDMAESFSQWQSVGFTPDLRTSSKELINDYFHQQASVTSAPDVHQIVDQLPDVNLFGCRKADWRGQKVAMICLKREGQQAHLFVVPKTALTGVDDLKPRTVEQLSGFPVSSWRDAHNAYVLVGHDRTTDLTKFF